MSLSWNAFPAWAKRLGTWAQDYHAQLRQRPVRASCQPGDVLAQLPSQPPEQGEALETILADFDALIVPNMTHWQHPRFFAYFPGNAAPIAVLAEHYASIMAAQCMLWQTSPAATELETRMMDWLRQGLGLPSDFQGVIQDSASSATLAAVLTMREQALSWQGNQQGLMPVAESGTGRLRIYASAEVHTSVDKAVWIAGLGQDNLVKIPSQGPLRAMDIQALAEAIAQDRAAGFSPAGVIAATGATSVGACDDVAAVCQLAKAQGLYVHLDAAWAGAAMICPEFRGLWQGVEQVDSLVFNPHKWLGAPFDCAAHFVRDPQSLVKTLGIQPDYLKTLGQTAVVNYSEWGVPLGRRFRALKLWFLLRAHGLEDLRNRLRNHVAWSTQLCEDLGQQPHIEITTQPILSLFSFRYAPPGYSQAALDDLNLALVQAINDDGRIYLTQTRLDERIVIRFQVGQFDTTQADVMMAAQVIADCIAQLD